LMQAGECELGFRLDSDRRQDACAHRSARWRARSSSADLPIPGSPRKTSAPPPSPRRPRTVSRSLDSASRPTRLRSSVKTAEIIGPRQGLLAPCASSEAGRMPVESRRVQCLGRDMVCSWERSTSSIMLAPPQPGPDTAFMQTSRLTLATAPVDVEAWGRERDAPRPQQE
jgi:hypothetical protein